MAGTVGEELVQQARSRYEAGEYRGCWEAAQEGLSEHPDDANLLRLAGKAGLELDEDGALEYLRKATEVSPDDADAWRDLGEGLVLEGRTGEAVEALPPALPLRPDGSAAPI